MSHITIRKISSFEPPLKAVVIAHQEAPRAMQLGEILLRRKLITREQLDQALALQRHRQQKLGEILLSRQLIKRLDLQRALVEQSWRKQGFWVIGNPQKNRWRVPHPTSRHP